MNYWIYHPQVKIYFKYITHYQHNVNNVHRWKIWYDCKKRVMYWHNTIVLHQVFVCDGWWWTFTRFCANYWQQQQQEYCSNKKSLTALISPSSSLITIMYGMRSRYGKNVVGGGSTVPIALIAALGLYHPHLCRFSFRPSSSSLITLSLYSICGWSTWYDHSNHNRVVTFRSEEQG